MITIDLNERWQSRGSSVRAAKCVHWFRSCGETRVSDGPAAVTRCDFRGRTRGRVSQLAFDCS